MPNYGSGMTSTINTSQEIWLLRHGETEWTLSGAHTSRTDLPLTPNGENAASRLGELLRGKQFAQVLSSPLRRAILTARLAGFAPLIDPDLHEWDYGDYEGRTTADIQKDVWGWSIWTSTPPNGESADQVKARAERILAHVRTVSGDVALFGHGHFFRVLAATWLDLEPQRGRSLALSTASASILGYEREEPVIKLWNRTV